MQMQRLNLRSGLCLLSLSAAVLMSACKTEPPPTPPEPAPAPAPAPQPEAPKRVYADPPAPTAAKPVQFPEIQSFMLENNNLPVYVVENHEVPLVSAQLVINAGSMDDEFLAEMTAEMLGEGTKKRSKAKIDTTIEQVGASISTGAGIHNTTLSTRVLKRDLKLALELMADEVMNPAFPADALDKLKKQAKTALKSAKSDSGTLADTLFGMVAYPEGHPYGRPLPTEAQIDAITLEGIKKFHGSFYKSNNSFLILSGDITVDEAGKLVGSSKAFGKWQKFTDNSQIPPNPLNKFKAYKGADKLTVHLVDRPASAQAEIRVGNLALARKHPDWVKFQLASTILGGGSTGRLFLDVREERGLTYGIYSQVRPGQAPGTWRIWTKTKTKKTADMMRAIFEHITRMRGEDPTETEFTDAVTQSAGSFPLQIETPNQIAGKVRTILTYGLDKDYWRTYRDEVRAVQMPDIKAVSAKYIHAVPVIVVVGKAKKVEPLIKEALPNAEIIKYNTDLQKL